MINNILFFVVIFVTNIIQSITGFAGTMLAMPFSISLVGLDTAKPILNVVSIAISVLVVVKNHQYINKKEVLKMSVFMLIGMAIGIYLLGVVPTSTLLYVYGALIMGVALKKLFIKKEVKLPVAIMFIVVVLAGIIHGMFVSGGSLLVIYAVYALKDKHQFRASLAILWILLNGILMFTHIQSGLFTTEVTIMSLLAIPTALLSMFFGNKIYDKIDQQLFLKITYVLLLISGVLMFI